MSDGSDDDLANNYGPTTPAPTKKTRPRAGSAKPVAGPSTKPSSKTAASKAAAANAPSAIELDDDEDVVMAEPTKKRRKGSGEDSEEVVVMPGPAKGSKKGTARSGPAVNGTTKSTAKGKGKAAQVNGATTETMDVDKDEEVKEDEDEQPDSPVQRPVRGATKQAKAKGGTAAAAAARHAKVEEKLNREIESLRAQLEHAEDSAREAVSQRDKLLKQLDEAFQVRQTEPEQMLAEYKAYLDESLQKRDDLIRGLEEQLAQLQSPSKAGSSYTLHFLTREAAEEEKRAQTEEIKKLKDVIKQRDATIAAKEREIQEGRQEAEATRMELNAEIERSKSLASRAPGPAASRSAKTTSSEPRNTPVIKLYEDMTNILITNVKVEKSPDWPEAEEESLTCIYTYTNPDENLTFSLNFTLRNSWSQPEGTPAGQSLPREQCVQKLKYQPKDLEKERPEIVERLQFFKDPFIFARDQLTVFVKTLADTVVNVFEGDEGEGDASTADVSAEPIVIE